MKVGDILTAKFSPTSQAELWKVIEITEPIETSVKHYPIICQSTITPVIWYRPAIGKLGRQ